MIFMRRPKALVLKLLLPVAKSARLTVRKDEAARRRVADTDGRARRVRQLVEDNRLL